MTKITPYPKETEERLIITHEGVKVELGIIGLDNKTAGEIADAILNLTDSSGHQVAFLTYADCKMKFFRRVGGRDEPVYAKEIPAELLEGIKSIELEIVRKWDELFKSQEKEWHQKCGYH